MKIFVFTIIIFSAMTFGIFANTYVLSGIVEEIEEMIDALPSPERLDDPEQTCSVYDISDKIAENEFLLSITLSHEDINDVKRSLSQLTAAFESKDPLAYREYIALLRESMRHIKKLAETSWDSIL